MDTLLAWLGRLGRLGAACLFVLLAAACSASSSTMVDDVADQEPTAEVEPTAEPAAAITEVEATSSESAPVEPTVEPAAEVADADDAVASDPAPLADAANGDGGTVTVAEYGDLTYRTEFCANDEDGLFNQGSGVRSDGVPFTINLIVQPHPLNDGTLLSIDVVYGQASLYGAPDLQHPMYSVTTFTSEAVADYVIEGTRVFGTATLTEFSDLGFDAPATIDVSFDAMCGEGEPVAFSSGASDEQSEPASRPGDGSQYCEIAQIEVDRAKAFSEDLDVTAFDLEEYLVGGLELMGQIETRPQEIAGELARMQSALEQARDDAAAVDYVFFAAAPTFVETIGSPEAIEAGLVIQEYNERVCGIVWNP